MLLRCVEIYLREQGVSAARFGRAAVGDPSFVFELRSGREPRPRTVTKVLAYMKARHGRHVQTTQKIGDLS